MLKYKIIACDMDGTFLNSKSEISEENSKAIEILHDKGVHFVPATGRAISEIPIELLNNEKIRYIITSNGAVVYDKITGEKISRCIEKDQLLKIYDILARYGAYISFRHNGRTFADANQQDEQTLQYLNVCAPHRYCMQFADHKSDLREFVSQIDDIEVFAVFFHDNIQKEMCRQKILALGNLKIVDAWDCNIEIFHEKSGKGEALKALADSLGISMEATIAVGDSENDGSMIEMAGMGLAMANAKDVIKEIADNVVCDNDSHVLDYILKNYFWK